MSFTDSGYEPGDRRCFHMKDPQTGEEFEYSVAMRKLYFKNTVSRYKLKRIISSRVVGLSVPESRTLHPWQPFKSQHQCFCEVYHQKTCGARPSDRNIQRFHQDAYDSRAKHSSSSSDPTTQLG